MNTLGIGQFPAEVGADFVVLLYGSLAQVQIEQREIGQFLGAILRIQVVLFPQTRQRGEGNLGVFRKPRASRG